MQRSSVVRSRTQGTGPTVSAVDPAESQLCLLGDVSLPPDLDFARIGITGVRLEALFEAVPLAIAVFDGDLRLVNANARYRELTGVARRRAVEGLDLRRVPQRARRSHRSDRHRAARRAAPSAVAFRFSIAAAGD